MLPLRYFVAAKKIRLIYCKSINTIITGNSASVIIIGGREIGRKLSSTRRKCAKRAIQFLDAQSSVSNRLRCQVNTVSTLPYFRWRFTKLWCRPWRIWTWLRRRKGCDWIRAAGRAKDLRYCLTVVGYSSGALAELLCSQCEWLCLSLQRGSEVWYCLGQSWTSTCATVTAVAYRRSRGWSSKVINKTNIEKRINWKFEIENCLLTGGDNMAIWMSRWWPPRVWLCWFWRGWTSAVEYPLLPLLLPGPAPPPEPSPPIPAALKISVKRLPEALTPRRAPAARGIRGWLVIGAL